MRQRPSDEARRVVGRGGGPQDVDRRVMLEGSVMLEGRVMLVGSVVLVRKVMLSRCVVVVLVGRVGRIDELC